MAQTVRYTLRGQVATLTLDDPATRNALGAQTLEGLRDALRRAAADPDVRVVVLTGAGGTFCSGADLSGSGPDGPGFAGAGPALLVEVLQALLDHPKPTIARVQGHVAGGGNGLVAACDLAVAVSGARFAFSEVRIGVAPAVVAVACLRVMGARDAAELMLTGERVWADRARTAGLLTAVVEPDALDATVAAWTEQLGQSGPAALTATKDLLRRLPVLDRSQAFSWAAELSAALFSSDEAAEGIAAFLGRRPPSWSTPH